MSRNRPQLTRKKSPTHGIRISGPKVPQYSKEVGLALELAAASLEEANPKSKRLKRLLKIS